MAKIIKNGCESCEQRSPECCINCFEKHEFNIFESLSVSDLDFLMNQKQRIQYNPGETIIKQNTNSSYVICIKEGIAKVFVEGSKGKNIIIRLIKHGDFITGGGLFNGNIKNFTISAVTPVTCCLIDSSKLAKLFTENSQFAIQLFRHHTKRCNVLLSQLVNLTQKYMPGRVADTLLYLKNDIFLENPYKVPITRQELAEMSNMTKESFVRILHEFKESKLIEVNGNTIFIKDENSLQSISQNG